MKRNCPIEADNKLASLHVEPAEGEVLTFRLVVWEEPWDADTDVRTVSNIKEQQVFCFPLDSYIQSRVQAYLTAWAKVMREVLATDQAYIHMPADFFNFKGKHPLLLKKAWTIDDFEKALRTKGRLGGLL
jgi:hypothetical protein